MDWLLSNDRRESVIMISGEQSMEAAIGALRRGADDFLIKPYGADQIRRAVTGALVKRQSERTHRLSQQRLQSSEQMHRYMVENPSTSSTPSTPKAASTTSTCASSRCSAIPATP